MNRLGFQARIILISLAAGLPACAALLILLWTGDHEPRVRYGFSLLAVGALSGGLILLYRKLTFQFQTLSNVVSALREGDFSIRARGGTDKGLGEFAAELNILGEVLRRQRLGAVEAAALLQKVMKEIDVAILAFDDGQRLRLINRAGQRLLGIPGEEALGKTAAALDLEDCVEGEPVRTLRIRLPGEAAAGDCAGPCFARRSSPKRRRRRSPARIRPFSSTMPIRSASPSNAIPTSACSSCTARTRSARFSSTAGSGW